MTMVLLETDTQYLDCNPIRLDIKGNTSASMRIPESNVDYIQIFGASVNGKTPVSGNVNMSTYDDLDIEEEEECVLLIDFLMSYGVVVKDIIKTPGSTEVGYVLEITDSKEVTIDDINFGKLANITKVTYYLHPFFYYESFEGSGW